MPGVVSIPPKFKKVLVVDDNDRYADAITRQLTRRGSAVVRARSAEEGLSILRKSADDFQCVITDITMETQLSGLRILSKAGKLGFRGTLVTASTGLDNPVAYLLNRFILGVLYRCDYLIPKKPIKRRGSVAWLKT